METHIRLAGTREEVARCFPVMLELRPHLTLETFVEQVIRQQREGYLLAYVEHDGEVVSCGGYRYSENLAWGRFLYVDDLVIASHARSHGHGDLLFDWLVAQARAAGCAQFQLDSGVQRFGAHRFYLRKRMDITSHHFGLKLS